MLTCHAGVARMQFVTNNLSSFYCHQQSQGDPNSVYNAENLAQCILDLFIAGTETTATTLQWALLLMATHPDIQGESCVMPFMQQCFG